MSDSLPPSTIGLLLLVTALLAVVEFRSIPMLSGPAAVTVETTTAPAIDSPTAPAITQPLFPGQPDA